MPDGAWFDLRASIWIPQALVLPSTILPAAARDHLDTRCVIWRTPSVWIL